MSLNYLKKTFLKIKVKNVFKAFLIIPLSKLKPSSEGEREGVEDASTISGNRSAISVYAE